MTKTVLAPGAPWPKPADFTFRKTGWRKVQIKTAIENLDYFAETHNELLNPQKGSGNPNAGKNFKKFNLQSS